MTQDDIWKKLMSSDDPKYWDDFCWGYNDCRRGELTAPAFCDSQDDRYRPAYADGVLFGQYERSAT